MRSWDRFECEEWDTCGCLFDHENLLYLYDRTVCTVLTRSNAMCVLPTFANANQFLEAENGSTSAEFLFPHRPNLNEEMMGLLFALLYYVKSR